MVGQILEILSNIRHSRLKLDYGGRISKEHPFKVLKS